MSMESKLYTTITAINILKPRFRWSFSTTSVLSVNRTRKHFRRLQTFFRYYVSWLLTYCLRIIIILINVDLYPKILSVNNDQALVFKQLHINKSLLLTYEWDFLLKLLSLILEFSLLLFHFLSEPVMFSPGLSVHQFLSSVLALLF